MEIEDFFETEEGVFKMDVDAMNTELICISVTQSFEKVNELMVFMKKRRFSWKNQQTSSLLKRCLESNSKIYLHIKDEHERTMIEMIKKNQEVTKVTENLIR